MTVSNPSATGFSNQKHGLTLSNGYLVVCAAVGGNTGKFWYSTDGGVTWIDYAADVLGPSSTGGMSIASYVDSGSVERIILTWLQSGTGGSRVNNDLYVMCGTLNAGRTTITWGTAVNYTATGTAIWSYPDVVVTPEGTGGMAFLAYSQYNGGTTGRTAIDRITISSSGVLTDNGGVFIDAGNNGSSYTYPSLDINLSTKDLFCSWSAGTTGSGKGIRFRRATYSAGTWTWQTEVEVDNTIYLQDTSHWNVCRWDGTRVVIGVFGWTGSTRPLRTFESTNFTSFTTRTHVADVSSTSQTRIEFGGMTVDTSTGDIYMFGWQFTSSNDNTLYYYKWTRSNTTLSSVNIVDEVVTTSGYVYVWYSSSTLRWLYTTGNNSPYAVKYDQLVLNVAPNTPTALQRTDTDNTITTPSFSAAMSDPNTGQNVKVRFEIWNQAQSTLLGSVDSSFAASPGTVTATYSSALSVGQYYVKAFAIDDLGASSGYTAFVAFSVTVFVTKDETLKWDVRANVPKDETLLWNVNANNIKDLYLLWNVNITPGPKDLTLLWNYNPVWTKVNEAASPPTWSLVTP